MGSEAGMALALPCWAMWLVVFDCWYGRAIWQPAEVAAQASVKRSSIESTMALSRGSGSVSWVSLRP
jgi:hypothetical protein